MLTDETIDQWLIEHYSGAKKLGLHRRWALKFAEGSVGIAPPPAMKVYRGLANVPVGDAARIAGEAVTGPRDVSWTLDPVMALRFASNEFTRDPTLPGRVAIVVTALLNPAQAVLNYAAIVVGRPRVAIDVYGWAQT